MNTVTRAHLTETIYTQVGLSRNESADPLSGALHVEKELGRFKRHTD